MKVKELMTSDVAVCGPDAGLGEVAGILWHRGVGFVPVVDGERRVLGIVTDRDLCVTLATMDRNAAEAPAGMVKSPSVFSCSPEDDVQAAMRIMRTRKVHRLPVLDEAGVLQGVLSVDDLVCEAATFKAGRQPSAVSYEGVIGVLKALCGRRGAAPASSRRQPVGVS